VKAYQMTGSGDGTFEIRDQTGAVIEVDGTVLQGLTLDMAGKYLYALSLLNKAPPEDSGDFHPANDDADKK
jgi:Flp pilus assembly protein TadD